MNPSGGGNFSRFTFGGDTMPTDTAMTVVENHAVAPLTPTDVLAQVELIQHVMKSVMQPDVHFGVIPGTGTKPSLYQPGAQKLMLTFRLGASFTIAERELSGGHREYSITCQLRTVGTEQFVGEGVGMCSSMESKYRWRNDVESTGNPVPKSYWQDRDQSLIGGKGFTPKKIDGEWFICKSSGERLENPDIADQFNTILKMAKKRAMVDAVLNATAASDIFTQDLEDIAANQRNAAGDVPAGKPETVTTSSVATNAAPDTNTGGRSVPPDVSNINMAMKACAAINAMTASEPNAVFTLGGKLDDHKTAKRLSVAEHRFCVDALVERIKNLIGDYTPDNLTVLSSNIKMCINDKLLSNSRAEPLFVAIGERRATMPAAPVDAEQTSAF